MFRSGSPLITESFRRPIQAFTDVGQRPAIVMPLRANESVLGVIAVARNESHPPFDDSYLDLVSDFARHAAMALTLSNARERQHELSVLADRERIAHDLHDHVIQRLFAAGMDLQGTIARSRSPEVVERLSRTVDDLQATINDIRRTIFDLQAQNAPGSTFRGRIEQLVADLTDNRNLAIELRMSGPISIVSADLARHAEAVITEAISNSVRHAGASRLAVRVTVADFLTVEVVDNGCGIPTGDHPPKRLGQHETTRRTTGRYMRIQHTAGRRDPGAVECAADRQLASPPRGFDPIDRYASAFVRAKRCGSSGRLACSPGLRCRRGRQSWRHPLSRGAWRHPDLLGRRCRPFAQPWHRRLVMRGLLRQRRLSSQTWLDNTVAKVHHIAYRESGAARVPGRRLRGGSGRCC